MTTETKTFIVSLIVGIPATIAAPTVFLIAELSAEGYVLIISAVFFGIAKLLSMLLEYRRAKEVANKVEVLRLEAVNASLLVAKKVEAVRLETHNAAIIVADKVESVRLEAAHLAKDLAEKVEAARLALLAKEQESKP